MANNRTIKNVFLVGAKGLGNYGGYETFISKLTEYHKDCEEIKYHIACKANGAGYMDENALDGVYNIQKNHKGQVSEFTYNNARCFKIRVPQIGAAQAIVYDVLALNSVCCYIKKHKIQNPIVYIMACRIGPFSGYFKRKINKLGGKVYLNPDGHEWKRSKWSKPVRTYWKVSEKMMVNNSDLVVCDSKNIEKYIHESYDTKNKTINTTFIAYGAEVRPSKLDDDDKRFTNWLSKNNINPGNYYLAVGRFVPENNYETMIREFMDSDTKRDFAIITTENAEFYDSLESVLHFSKDSRIKFVGTVYDAELLMKIRENAFAYIHGHAVGGTNPSLLEALGSTKLNLLLDVGFNREVGENATLYWEIESDSLSSLINKVDSISESEREKIGNEAKNRIAKAYSWTYICNEYYKIFQ